jgi:diguanylate cyclase (GGDEF)-like protein
LRAVLVPVLLALECVIAGLGLFLSPHPPATLQFAWLAVYLLVAFIIAYTLLFHARSFRPFPFIVLGVVLLNFFVQLTGGTLSFLWPGYFVFACVAAVFLPLPQTLATAGLILAIEAANMTVSSRWDFDRLPVRLAFAVSLIAVPGIISHIIRRTRREAQQARDEHERLIEHAGSIDPLGTSDAIAALTDESRLASNIQAARSREASFSGLIDLIYGFVPAHAYALFLKEQQGEREVFALRARRSDTDDMFLAPLGEVLTADKDNGILTGCARYLQPQYLSDIEQPKGTLGYYTRTMPIKSILAVPIVQDGAAVAVLVVDSLEGGAFSLETQDLVARFAPFFIQIIEKIRASQELSMRAGTLAGMHKISNVLNSTLELEQMLARLAKEIAVLVPYDFCLFLQYDEKTNGLSLLHHSGSVKIESPARPLKERIKEAVRGKAGGAPGEDRCFPLEDGTMIRQMLNQWNRNQSARPYHFSDLQGKEVLGLFDATTRLTRQLNWLSCWPLGTGEKFIGAFLLGSLRPDPFSEFHRGFLGTFSNQIALVMDNAILHRQISNLARTDGLTGLLNHRTFMEKLSEEYRRIDRQERPFSILLMDIDKFKAVNDTYGHPVGDVAIKAVAHVLKETVRATDFVARYGGEEFAVGMVDTNPEGAEQMAERVRAIMEKTVVTTVGSTDLRVTLSIGVSNFPRDTRTLPDLVTLADNALYHAKRTGRNRVCVVKDLESDTAGAKTAEKA